MPSPERIASVEDGARACWQHMINREAETYERGKLQDLGVRTPPHSLHDYSADGTRIVIECIKLRLEAAQRIWNRQGGTSFGIAYQMAPYWGALQAEENHLARLEHPFFREAAQ